MSEVNNKLTELYKSQNNGIKEIFDSKLNIDGPHLMHCWDDSYNVAQRKIMFIGQEGTGNIFRDYLGHPTDNSIEGERIHYSEIPNLFIENCIENYKMIVNGQLKRPGGEFWRKLIKINQALNNESLTPSFLYTNVSKYCNGSSYGSPPLSWHDHKSVVEKFNVLQQEIQLSKPDVVIFFSGPNYDDKIRCQFNNEVEFIPLVNDISTRVLARVKHPSLPENTYRTYHPGYLNRAKLSYIDIIINDILNNNV